MLRCERELCHNMSAEQAARFAVCSALVAFPVVSKDHNIHLHIPIIRFVATRDLPAQDHIIIKEVDLDMLQPNGLIETFWD